MSEQEEKESLNKDSRETTEETEVKESEHKVEERNYEEEAKTMGWVPKENFKGDPSNWTDARKFVEKGETELPLLKSRVRDYDVTLKQARDHMSKQSKTLEEQAKRIEFLQDLVLKNKDSELARREETAFEEQDKKEYERIKKERQDLYKAQSQFDVKKENIQKTDNYASPAIMEWIDKNPWYMRDKQKTEDATALYRSILQYNPGITEREALDRLTKKCSKLFSKPKPTVSSVGGSQKRGYTGGRKKSFNDLPLDAQEICKNFVKKGMITKDQYVKEYFNN